MDCAPATYADLVEWRAEDGLPRDVWQQLNALSAELLGALASECGLEVGGTGAYEVAVTCTTATGYRIDASGRTWGASDGSGHDLSLTIAATADADGAWPVGRLDARIEITPRGTDNTGGTWTQGQLTWSFTDPGALGLPPEGTLAGRFSDGWSGCGASAYAALAGELDGCPVSATFTAPSTADAGEPVESWDIEVGATRARVALLACGSRVGTLDDGKTSGALTFLDEAWTPVARTDADGDGCATEDCDCDDGDPTVYGGAPDVDGDGLDADCNGSDAEGEDECADVVSQCTRDFGILTAARRKAERPVPRRGGRPGGGPPRSTR